MANLRILFDETVSPCDCRWLLWSVQTPDGWELHCHPLCPPCEASFRKVIRRLYPGIEVSEVSDAANK